VGRQQSKPEPVSRAFECSLRAIVRRHGLRRSGRAAGIAHSAIARFFKEPTRDLGVRRVQMVLRDAGYRLVIVKAKQRPRIEERRERPNRNLGPVARSRDKQEDSDRGVST
jgi:hypothetical protein